MINQTPDLAWDILMEMASGQVGEGQAQQEVQQRSLQQCVGGGGGGLYGKSDGTWCPLLQDTKTDLHTFDDSPEHMPFNWVLYCKCHRERGSDIETGINHRTNV